MGSTSASGCIKLGTKRITFVEAGDALPALKLAGFTSFAKPGGSKHVVNNPIDNAVRAAWRSRGIRFGIFELRVGDAYFIPAGIIHEFQNTSDVLSVAWNLLPHKRCCGAAAALLKWSLAEVERVMRHQPERREFATEHAPLELLLQLANTTPEQLGFS
eukprot:TRINITY_DN950_c0_g1_i3.p3 TRINITY_DN950_c0_g1~~TRINITY_DN950_c0_g1_i3.p3  ORF type:complete len:159 (-),score=74.35 TRINITY_DN950_c0_g1_i3:600-1076(-)